MRINVHIDQYILNRSAFVHKAFIHTDCAVALVLKELFPGIHVRHTSAGFCNRDGYEVTIPLPEIASDWIAQFDRTKPIDRRSLPTIKFKLALPELAIQSIGPMKVERILKSSHNLTMVQ